MKMKTCVRKLKEELLHNGLRGESRLSSAPSLHLPGTYSIGSEAIDGSFKICNKLRSPSVAKSKGRLPSTRKQSVVERVARKLKLTKIRQKKGPNQVAYFSFSYLYILFSKSSAYF
jgi:hypothetical protein